MSDAIKTNVAFKYGNNLALNAPVINGSLINSRLLTVTGTIWQQTYIVPPVYPPTVTVTVPSTAAYVALFVDSPTAGNSVVMRYNATIGATPQGVTVTATAISQQYCYCSPLLGRGSSGTLLGTMTLYSVATVTVRLIFWGG